MTFSWVLHLTMLIFVIEHFSRFLSRVLASITFNLAKSRAEETLSAVGISFMEVNSQAVGSGRNGRQVSNGIVIEISKHDKSNRPQRPHDYGVRRIDMSNCLTEYHHRE